MGWLNEFDWFLLFLLIMKLAVLWTVAACVAAIDLSCDEYCSCLSSGHRNVDYQPGCDCMYAEKDFENSFKDSGIYYEPISYVSLPAYIYNHPFYIINPILQLRGRNSTNTPQQTIKIQHQHAKHVSDSSEFSAKIEIDIDNTHSSHKRKEKDIQADHQRLNSPIYLDVHFETDGGERSASSNTFTAEDLKQTEQSLIVCAELYALLNYRKNDNITHLNGIERSQIHKHDHLTNSELMKAIDDKCVHISNILQKSLNEIKSNRPTKVNSGVGSIHQYQENNEILRETDVLNSEHNADMITENNIQQPVHFSEGNSTENQDYEDKDYVDVIHTERETQENEANKYSTLSSQVTTTTVTSISNEGMATLGNTDYERDPEEVLMRDDETSTEKQSNFTSISIGNEYPLHSGNHWHTESTNNVESSTSPDANDVKQDDLENRRYNSENEYHENRSRYKEEDVPLAKVITHEFSNDTVQSYINGTEDVNNGDFKNVDADDESGPKMTDAESTISVASSKIPIESDIQGNLYFLVNKHQIPARFVQKPNGTLHIGIDAITICDKFKQDGEFVSKLFSTLCKCYESDNCTNIQN